MKILSASNTSGLPFLMLYAALVAQGATGCSSKVNGFVSMGGDLGGSSAVQRTSTGGDSSTAPAGGGPSLQTGAPTASGGEVTGGGSAIGTDNAQAGTATVAVGGTTAIPSTETGGSTAALGTTSAIGGTQGTNYVISTNVAVVKPTCTGPQIAADQMALIEQLSSQNSTCNHARMVIDPAVISLLFLVDATEAMALPVQDTADLRWDVVKRGILGFIEKYPRTTVEFAVAFYGAYQGSTNIANCDVDGYVSPAIPMGRFANSPADVGAYFDAMRDNLHYPATLYPALEGALGYAANWQANNLERSTAVVLVTDGRNQVCDKTLAEVQALANRYAGTNQPNHLHTFVVGVAGDPASLDVIAAGGGTDRAYLVDGPGASEQFTASLENVVDSMWAWFAPDISLGQVSPTDPAYVVVRDLTGEQGTYVVPQLESAANCAEPTGGWYFTVDNLGRSRATYCECSRPNLGKAQLSSYYGCTLPFYTAD